MSEQYLVCRTAFYNCYYEKIGKEIKNITDELPFEIPESWTWVRHNSIFEIFGGSQPPKSKFSKIPKDGYIRLYQIRDYGPNPDPIYIQIKDAHKTTKKGDILLARYGASVGKVFWAENGAYNVAMAKVEKLYESNFIDFNYMYAFYKSPLYQLLVKNNSRSAQAGFNKNDLSELLLPIPPFEEQKRIVKKIQNFEPLIQQYEQREKLLSILEISFEEQLKASILQYAIEGKLVKQDPNDEPASVLLERIKMEKEKLIREGKIKRGKRESEIVIGDDKNYYVSKALPASWVLVKAKQLTKKIQYGLSISGQKSGKYKLLRITDIQKGQVNWNTLPFCDISEQNYTDYKIERDDIFIARTGGTIGKSFRLVESKENVVFAGYLIRFQLIFNTLSEYISRYLNSPAYWKQVSDKSMGTGQPNINGVSLGNLVIPLPPVSEQKRINNKINKLFCIIKSY